MNKRKLLSLALSLCMVAILAVGGTLAYFTDNDSDVNTMTLGKVDIEQIEEMRNDEGTLVAFEDGQKMLPATADPAWNDKIAVNGANYDAMDVGNQIDKVVTVKNEDDSETAYIRTIFAFEHSDPNGDGNYSDGIAWKLHTVYNQVSGTWMTYTGELDNIVIDGKLYSVASYTYADSYEPGETTEPSLLQVFFDKSVTNEDMTGLGNNYAILAISQAVQAEGFDDAVTALNAGFGEITAENVKTWFAGLTVAD